MIPEPAPLRRALAEPDAGQLERLVYGSSEADAIAELVDAWCAAELHARIASWELYRASVGSVHGVVLADGRRIVIKVVREGPHAERLVRSRALTAALAARGYPCPRPLAEPAPLGRGLAAAETFLAGGRAIDPSRRGDRRAIAVGLAELHACTRGLAIELPRAWLAEAALYGEAHDPRFDFEATSRGAEWIDELARRAKGVLVRGAGHDVLGHNDWRAEHVRLEGERIVATYDWDSAVRDREPIIVGNSAHLFTTNWQVPALHALPQVEEIETYVADYESARPSPFTHGEREAVAAAVTCSLAYTSRCEHSDEHKLGWTGAGIRSLLRAWSTAHPI